MSFTIASDLSFCIAGDRAIFLDIPGNRYFRLADDLDASFRALLTDRHVDANASRRLIDAGVIVRCENPATIAAPNISPIPLRSLDNVSNDLAPSHYPAAIASMARAAVDMRRGRLTVGRIIAMAALRSKGASANEGERAAEIAGAHAGLALFTRVHESCLWRSVALKRHLARHQIAASLILAVQARPFGAHCWVQHGDMLLNDRLERIGDFTPILEIR